MKINVRVVKATATAAFAVAIAGATAVPAMAGVVPGTATTASTSTASTSTASTSTAVPAGLQPTGASWTTADKGIVLAYPSVTPGAEPYLLQTLDGGQTWRSLPAPPLTYPADHTQPYTAWADGIIAATDGTTVVTTRDSGRHWTTEELVGASGSFNVDSLVITSGRVFALVTTPGTAAVYSGTPASGELREVKGLSVTGGEAYGDISAVGGLQVDLGTDFTAQQYWYSKNGISFTAASLPCPATTMAWLGGVRSGKVVALCSDSPSTVGPGSTAAQLQTAPSLGGTFTPSGAAFVLPNPQEFAAASPQAATIATEGNVTVTTDAGTTWTAGLSQANGAFWTSLTFPDATTGFVVGNTVNNSLQEVDTLYRTTNSGETWSAVPLP
ncbi:MAG TPA: hypothetical protein VG142_15480 [Trebonia sp.]|nr:hypothetical protein [Trebonia sp.]